MVSTYINTYKHTSDLFSCYENLYVDKTVITCEQKNKM